MSKCAWREDDEGNWQTDCGGRFSPPWVDMPSDNGMRWCCYCGGKLVEVDYTEPTMEQPVVAATLSRCCGFVRFGWRSPDDMHNDRCREFHDGKQGKTYYLSDSGLVMDEDGTMRRRT